MKFFNITCILLCLSNFFNNKYHKIIFILFIMSFYFLFLDGKQELIGKTI